MKNCNTLLILLVLYSISSFGQKINGYEYWIDGNYGKKISKAITPSSNFTLKPKINVASLDIGLHEFDIHFKDSADVWSSVLSKYFYKANSKIISYEYWIDGNYNTKVVQTITPSNSFILNTPIDASSLSKGIHQIDINVKDSLGAKGSVLSKYFYTGATKIIGYEYWIDGNYNNKIAQAITPANFFTLTAPSNITALNAGLHEFDIRFKDSNNVWSSILSKYFYKGAYNVIAYEYWIDDGNENKTVINVSPSPILFFKSAVDLSNVFSGFHSFNMRFKDEAGNWSLTISKSFFKPIKDVDKDGLADSIETVRYGTDTLNIDTNNDWLADGINVFTGRPPLFTDTDGDGIINIQELMNGTSAILWDTDFDGVSDKLDPFPFDRFRTKLPPTNAPDHTAPVITLKEPF